MAGDAFRALASQVLAPELAAGDVVVVDNLPARKVGGVRQLIDAIDVTTIIGRERGRPASMLDFAARHKIAPQVEHLPLSWVNDAFSQPSRQGSPSGRARSRLRLTRVEKP
jgi:D-arabinose 1-dehydrogenase-like Zn-dependent alcohol dehydrogenase